MTGQTGGTSSPSLPSPEDGGKHLGWSTGLGAQQSGVLVGVHSSGWSQAPQLGCGCHAPPSDSVTSAMALSPSQRHVIVPLSESHFQG